MHGKQDSTYLSTINATDELRNAAARQAGISSGISSDRRKPNPADIDDIVSSKLSQSEGPIKLYNPNYHGYVFTVKPESSVQQESMAKDLDPRLLALARAKKVNKSASFKFEHVNNGRDKL